MGKWRGRAGVLIDMLDGESAAAAQNKAELDFAQAEVRRLSKQVDEVTGRVPTIVVEPRITGFNPDPLGLGGQIDRIVAWAARWTEKLELDDVDRDAAEATAAVSGWPVPISLLDGYLINAERNYARLLKELESVRAERDVLGNAQANHAGEVSNLNGQLRRATRLREEHERQIREQADRLVSQKKEIAELIDANAELRRENTVLENERDTEMHRAEIVVAEALTFGERADIPPMRAVAPEGVPL